MTLIASMLLLSSTTYATESVNHKTHMVQKQAMTKQDMQAVFGTQHVKANALSQGEMVKTEGEFWQWVVLGIAAFLLTGDSSDHSSSNNQGGRHMNFAHGGGQMSQ